MDTVFIKSIEYKNNKLDFYYNLENNLFETYIPNSNKHCVDHSLILLEEKVKKLFHNDPQKADWQRVIIIKTFGDNSISYFYCSWLADEGSNQILVPSKPDTTSIPEVNIETLEEFKDYIKEVGVVVFNLLGWDGKLPLKSSDFFSDIYIMPYSENLFKLLEDCLDYSRNLMNAMANTDLESNELDLITQHSNKLMEILSYCNMVGDTLAISTVE